MKTLVLHHKVVKFSRCDEKILKSRRKVKNILCKAILSARATIVEARSYNHARGVGCFVVIRESHVAITTFPEYSQAILDIHTCGTKMQPQEAIRYVAAELRAKSRKVMIFF